MLPVDFPPWQTVYRYFRTWTRQGLWQQINEKLVRRVRERAGRNLQPSAAVIDSQSVKTSEGGEQREVDVHKQTPGRKRHIVVERTFGWLSRYRRLSRDFEHTVLSSESMVYVASIRRMLRMAPP